jgi:histidinol dehydrogenase
VGQIVYKLPEEREALNKRLASRQNLYSRSLIEDISTIFEAVELSGDQAVIEATERFDKIPISSIRVPDEVVMKSLDSMSSDFMSAVQVAARNIRQVNEALLPESYWETEIREGTIIGEKTTPLDSVGLWVPTTKGPLISTALMLVVAARVAGVTHIVVGMPPRPGGQPDFPTLAAAKLAGADEFVIGNGVAVIAGFSIGTDSIPEADGIFGPGPGGIAAAMSLAFSYGKRTVVGIGPTDCAIIADETANPKWLAYDLLSEAEHGPDSSAFLVTDSQKLADDVERILRARINEIKQRRDILEKVFGPDGMGAIAVVPDLEEACHQVNCFAPEHLVVACDPSRQEGIVNNIVNAGEILLGHHTPFSAANYAIGITAVLPTNGFARIFSGITCKDMIKVSTIGKLSATALHELTPCITQIAEYEGLPRHADAAKVRSET